MICKYCKKSHGKELKWLYKGRVSYVNDPVLQTCIVLRRMNSTTAGDYLRDIFKKIMKG